MFLLTYQFLMIFRGLTVFVRWLRAYRGAEPDRPAVTGEPRETAQDVPGLGPV